MTFKSRINRIFQSLSLALLLLSSQAAEAAPSVWDVLRSQFSLSHELNRPEVQHQLRWLAAHPGYIQKLAQSEPYIYHIVNEIKKRKLPGELALIPMLESAYDPFAYSGAGAAGLWQLMPGTGNNLGLKQDWWFDGRRSIRPATDAALNYLAYLNKFFGGNWILAVAAYDSGEGTVSRLMGNNPKAGTSFWSLPLPQETRAYVPRLLAFAEIVQNPGRYHISLPNIPHLPYFEEVNIGSQIDLSHAAKLAGISYKELIKLNPGYNRWATAPYRPYKLLIPVEHADDFRSNLAHLPEEQRVNWTRHQVSAGDNLVIIARKYHTTVNLIKQLNQLKSNAVRKGQYVLIPSNKKPDPSLKPSLPAENKGPHFVGSQQYKTIHIVQKNENMSSIAKQYQVTEAEIRQWNQLSAEAAIKPGQQLSIYKPASSHGLYTVQSGDTLSAIAKSHHSTVKRLLSLNPELQRNRLKLGQTIQLG